ncbi:unnamed protein product, partial [Mesorhabditis belari]|uniref:Transthyretin-like family protein n=1 Tax=Mesorhabditis belari TaxID=2138241 RepID=A0AAF3E9A3_9BILA
MLLAVILTIFSVLHGTSALFGIGSKQSVAVRGRLTCNGMPASNVYVKMYDDDVLWDSKMGETHSDTNGFFQLIGTGREISTVDPKVNFYHDCNNGDFRCPRKFTIKIPDQYVAKGSTATMPYDFGVLELSGKMPGESHDCIHRKRR